MRLAVWRCFRGAQVRPQYPVDDAGEGLQLGPPERILPPVARRDRVGGHLAHRVPVRPNTRDASLMLMPSTMTALRTRRYTSTLYIRRTIHGVDYDPMEGGRRHTFQPPNVSRSIRPRGPIYLRRLQ